MVGIGASAGGLEALEKLFSAMPPDSGLAFVVVQHLDPRHPSILADLLGRRARIPVSTAENGARPEPDHVYVIAPKTILTIDGGALRIAFSPDEPAAGRIDAFLSSLARDRGESAVGVILSGAGSDGVAGLRAIKDHGGLVLAQDPQTAAHGSMPQAAIEAGVVDEVLAVDQIPSALLAHARHLASTGGTSGAGLDPDLAGSLPAFCALVQQRTGHDFSGYKEATLLRRIRRRVHVQGAASATAYLRMVERDPAEAQRLLKDLLVGVTKFFRDPETFATLAREVLPRILEGKPANAPIRIWVPGCSSGEEAYSIAILVHEHLAREKARRVVQIFGTDIDPGVIAEARAGRYPGEIADQVAPERLDRFFVREGPAWRVGTELREMCIFSVHSLIRDPPFSALDLISCRNVLIYLEPELQKKVIPLFHYALRTGGYVLLGPAEALANHVELFEAVDRKHRIFRRRESMARPQVEFPLAARAVERLELSAPGAAPAPTPRRKATEAIERMLLDDYAPPCAVVNGRGDIEFVAGHLGRFLAPPAGAPTANLLDAVRDSLRRELRTALHAASTSGARVVRDGVPVELEDGVHRVRLTARPVPGAQGLFAVVVQERALDEVEAPGAAGSAASSPALEQVESELRTTRADLKAAIESAEAANEELRSANEELISTNEELQSANEEMQTSKEELQSLNEELETVNAELGRKVDELDVLNSDLQNLFASTEIATVFLDRDLRIARFTPAATALLHLLESDVGRPLADFGLSYDGRDLVADAREALRLLKPLERQVRAGDPAGWFILRVVPYRAMENVIAGAVITFVDVSDLKRAEEELRAARERAEWLASFPARNPIPIVEVDSEGRVRYANASAERLFPDVHTAGSAHPWLASWDEVVHVFRELGETSHERVVQIGEASFQQHMYYVPETQCIRIYSVEVTRRRRAEEALRESEERFRLLVDGVKDHAIFMLAPDGTVATWNSGAERLKGYRPEEIVGQHFSRFFTQEDVRAGEPQRGLAVAAAEGQAEEEGWRVRKDGSRFWASTVVGAIRDQAGKLRGFAKITRDFTERKRLADALRESEEKYSVVHERAPFAIVLTTLPERTTVSVNAAFSRMFGFAAEEASGKTCVELGIFDAGTEAKVTEELQRCGAVRDLVVTRRTRSGAPLVLSLSLDRVTIRGREHVLTTIQDITARDQAEEALRQSEERFRTLFETMSEGFSLDEIIFDERGKPSDLRYLQVNPAFERYTGLRAADIVGRTAHQLFPAAEPGWLERYGRVALTGEPAHFLAKFGPLAKWFEVSAYRTGPDRIAVVFFDITARKQAEEAVERSRQGLSRLAEASLSVIRETDLQGMLQAVSEAALALTGARLATCGHGYVAGQFTVGGSARAPGAPSCPPGNMFAFEKGGVHVDLAAGAEAIRLADGEMRAHPRWWGLPEGHVPMRGLLGVRMVGRNGQTSGLILVTDKEDGEFTEEDESLLRQLATIASLALQHVEARISLEESDRSKNHFLAVLSHELRNPLAPIRNSVYVLDRAAPGGEQARRAHRVIDRQVGHLTRLVDDLLDVTRISRGKIQLRRERLDLSDLVRRAAEDHRASFASNGLDLEISVPERPLWIAADRTRVAQVVGNLLENSVKFTERGGRASIAVEGNAVLRQAIIRVRDTGAGILADMLPRVFEPFMQADTTLDRSKGGLGLGLALVKGLVEMHGGTVSVESEGPGKGAEFTVRLPLDASADAPADQPAGPGRGAPRRILVIEDNADAADSLRELLELGKHTVEVAFSGTEGIEKARAFRPDVVLCDIGLPGMNGYQVAREMRTDPALRGTRLVALTGYAAPEDLARSREAGFHAHVAKPPTPEVLEEALSASAPHAPGRPEDP